MKKVFLIDTWYWAKSIEPSETSGKNCIFWRTSWYELTPMGKDGVNDTLKEMIDG